MLSILQIIVSLTLISVILLQSQGTGLGSAWGGDGKSLHTRRGAEKFLLQATIVLLASFLALSLLPVLGLF